MKTDHEKVNRLRQETGRDYGFCQKALSRNRNDYDRALEYINSYNGRFLVRSYKHLVSILLGEKSYRLIIASQDEEVMDIPLILPIVVCIILPVPSMVLACIMIIIMLTNSSLRLEVESSKQKEKREETDSEQTEIKAKPVVTTDDDGYSSIDIL